MAKGNILFAPVGSGMRGRLAAGMILMLSLVLSLMLASAGVAAPSLQKRIENIEKQLQAVQRKVFTPGSMFPEQQGQGGATPPVGLSGGQGGLADMENRVAQIETQLRQLTGQVEETNHRINKLIQRLDLLSDDYEFRLTELERGRGGAGTSPGIRPDAGSSGANSSGANSIVPPAGAGGDLLPGATVQEKYDHAYGMVTRGDYVRAEAALKEFLRLYPQEALAGNAKYWLGQTYYARGMFPEATRAFLEGYNQYPNNQKGPAFLLKIGMSLYAMGEKKDACDAYRELAGRFPDSVESKNRRPAEEKKAGCQ